MIQLTNFNRLKQIIKSLGITEFINNLSKDLNRGDWSPEGEDDLVLGENGIYHLKNKILTKVILHISDIDIKWVSKKDSSIKKIDQKNSNNKNVITHAHKYHFSMCKTLENMFSKKKKHRYYLSHRIDGYFAYKFIDQNSVILSRKDQKLNPCRYCLNVLSESTGKKYVRSSFHPRTIWAARTGSVILKDDSYLLDCGSVPNIYSKDWAKIAEKAKRDANYTCEYCGINLANQKNYLDCHHVNSDKTDNRISNLEVLCVECHSKNHPHMKNNSRLIKFLKLKKSF